MLIKISLKVASLLNIVEEREVIYEEKHQHNTSI